MVRTKSHILLFCLLAVLIIVALLPGILGYVFKREYLKALEIISRDTQVKFTVKEYEMGWLHSNVLLEVTPPSAWIETFYESSIHPVTPVGFTVEQYIQHGPLIFDATHKNLIFALALIHGDIGPLPNADTKPMVEVLTKVTFGGDALLNVTMHGFDYSIPFVGKLMWQGLRGTVLLSMDREHMDNIKSDMTLGALTLESSFGSLDVSSGTFKNNLFFERPGLWQGFQSLSLPSFSFDFADHDSKLLNITLNHSFDVKENFYDTQIEMNVEEIMSSDLSVKPLNLKVGAYNINAKNMADYLSNPQNSIIAYPYATLITPSTQLLWDVDFGTNYGSFNLQAKNYWPTDVTLKTLEDIKNFINYDVNIRVSETLVNHFLDHLPNPQLYQETHPTNVATNTAPTFDQRLNVYAENKVISLYAASQLKDFMKKPLTYGEYVTLIERLRNTNEIAIDVVPELKNLYALGASEAQQTGVNSYPKNQTLPSQSEDMRNNLQNLIAEGYVIRNNDELSVSIVYRNGQMTINGKAMAPPADLQKLAIPRR